MRISKRLLHPTVLALYALLTLVMTWPAGANLAQAIPGDGFDGWQNYWNLWWMKVALVERIQSPFVTDLLYHPTGVNLYFHTLNPFNGLVTLPIQLSGNLFLAYNGVVFLSWVLGGYGVFLLVRWLLGGDGWLAPFLAGLVYVFAPFHMAHLLGHMQVMSLEWIPFYILALLRGMRRARQGRSWARDGLLAGLFLALTGLCDWYFVLYLFLFTGLAVIWQVGEQLRGKAARIAAPSRLASALSVLGPPLLAGGVFLLLLSPILLPMIREALRFRFMVRPAQDLYILSASLLDFLVPNRLHPLFRPDSFQWPGNQVAPVSERTISLGYTPLLLALLAAWKRPRLSRFWLASGLFFLLLALGPALHLGSITWADVPADPPPVSWTPYGILNRVVPFMRISRSVSRFALMVELSLAVAAGLGFHWLLQGRGRSQALLLGVAGVALLLAEFWVAPFPVSPPDTPDFYRQLAQEPGAQAVLNLPMNFDRPGYLLYQTVHRKPLTVAYISRDDPRTLTQRAPVLQHFRHLGPDILADDPADVGRTVLADLDVGWVVLDRYKMPGGLERRYTTELAQAIFAGQEPLFQDERLTVYRVTPPAQPRPYLLLGPLNWGPLTLDETGQVGRSLGPEPALLTARHRPSGTRLAIRYRTPPGTSLAVLAPGTGEVLALLPPAPQGGEEILALADRDAVALAARGAGEVRIERLTLLTGKGP